MCPDYQQGQMKKMKVLAKKFSPCRLSQNIIFCHKTHFCGRYSAPDLRQTGGPCVLKQYFCILIWHSQACVGLVCTPARYARWGAITPPRFADCKCLYNDSILHRERICLYCSSYLQYNHDQAIFEGTNNHPMRLVFVFTIKNTLIYHTKRYTMTTTQH